MDTVITSQELNSLRFYQGDISHYDISTEKEERKYSSTFYQTKGAYHILNLLLYPGMENEITRICREKKKIPVHLLEDLDELISIYRDMFIAMCKYQHMHRGEGSIHAFRKDRMQSMAMVRNHSTYAFTSCSLKDGIDEYFMKKAGILLLEYNIPDSIPYIVMNDVLNDNAFHDQKEVLLPPFVAFTEFPMEFTEKEMAYKDVNDEPPKVKYLLTPTHLLFEKEPDNSVRTDQEPGPANEYGKDDIAHAIWVLTELTEGRIIQKKDTVRYCDWKKKVQVKVRKILETTYYLFNSEGV